MILPWVGAVEVTIERETASTDSVSMPPEKSWNFKLEIFRPTESWKINLSPGKSWKNHRIQSYES